MINFVGYNFVDDIKSLDPYPTSIRRLTSTKIQHGFFNHINIYLIVKVFFSPIREKD